MEPGGALDAGTFSADGHSSGPRRPDVCASALRRATHEQEIGRCMPRSAMVAGLAITVALMRGLGESYSAG